MDNMAVAGISVNRSTDPEKQNLGVSGTPGLSGSPNSSLILRSVTMIEDTFDAFTFAPFTPTTEARKSRML